MIYFTLSEVKHYFTVFSYQVKEFNYLLEIVNPNNGELFILPKKRIYTPLHLSAMMWANQEKLHIIYPIAWEQIKLLTKVNRKIKSITNNKNK